MVLPGESTAIAREFAAANRVKQEGRTLSVLTSNGVDGIVARAEALGARSIDVQPLALREMFIELVKGEK
jgi:hypothetical protein